MGKLNMVLVQILKQDWPDRWERETPPRLPPPPPPLPVLAHSHTRSRTRTHRTNAHTCTHPHTHTPTHLPCPPPPRWQSFLPDIISASKTNETLCENSMTVLKLLSEEVFDFSRGELTQVRDACAPVDGGGGAA